VSSKAGSTARAIHLLRGISLQVAWRDFSGTVSASTGIGTSTRSIFRASSPDAAA
jgi:hypothetical protein